MKNQWNYEAWNQDHDREATDSEMEWCGWKRPEWSDESLKTGELPGALDMALSDIQEAGGSGLLRLDLACQTGDTISVEIEFG